MKISNKIHLNILEKFKEYRNNRDKKTNEWVQHYLGSNKPTLGIKSSEMVAMAKDIVRENNFDKNNLKELLDSLYSKADTFAEIDIAARLLGSLPNIRKELEPEILDYWLNFTHGWAEIDVLCQNNFTANEVLENWIKWEKVLVKFSDDENVSKRRASMVLLTKSLRESDDKRLSELAFAQIEKLKWEKDILITKAISWLLRSLVKHHKEEVLDYLEAKQESLPKIAYREAYKKAMTGRKNG
ncbi:MAG TPA: DNA alkylation repair protein [Candidatus Methanoperedens sp.]|nr:DNA alkylation repair protein [Candidatus Methanoperedens sp.]